MESENELFENSMWEMLPYSIISSIQLGIEEAEIYVLKYLHLDANTKLEIIYWLMETSETLIENAKAFIEAVRDNKTVKPAEDIELERLMGEGQISPRTFRVFMQVGYDTLQAVSELTEKQAKRLRNCGPHTIEEIKSAMDVYGMSFKEDEHE